MGMENGDSGLGTGDSKTGIRQTVRLQTGVSQNAFPGNSDRLRRAGRIEN